MMIDNEQYEGLLMLAKQALMFYANENNYTYFELVTGSFSRIGLDKGFQAKFVLQQIEQLEQQKIVMVNDFSNIKFEEPITNPEDIMQIIKDNLNGTEI
jgi:hypothetical protein